MKVWIVTEEVMSTIDEWTPQDVWTGIEKIFDSKDKAISYVRESIKNAIDEQMKDPEPDVEIKFDRVPTDEEILKPGGIYWKTIDKCITHDYSYIINEYDVE